MYNFLSAGGQWRCNKEVTLIYLAGFLYPALFDEKREK
jgi:hypothetical protein